MGGAILLFFALILTIDSVVGQDCMKPGRWVSYSDSKATSPDSSYQVIQTDDGLIAVPSIQVTWNSGVITCSDNVYLVADYPEVTFVGILNNNGERVDWAGGSYWVLEDVHTVHVVFMNHLDVGYNGIAQTGFINNVLNVYFHNHLPRVWRLQQALREGGYTERYLYTTHPWLVSMYLDCPDLTLAGVKLLCPNDRDKAEFERAIRRGDINWHAGPFNLQPENMDVSLFEYGLTIAKDLDKRFGINRPFGVLSQRDVPGMTRSVIPLLVKNKVLGITVGQNQGTPAVGVPKIFRWREPSTSKHEVICMDHPFGYGGIDYVDNVVVGGNALAYAFRTDNSGPPQSIKEILDIYSSLRAKYSGAKVKASTYEEFVQAILPDRNKLPVVTHEIGDVWIDGISSDPLKESQFREISRARTECLKSGKCDPNDQRIKDMSRYLIKIPEHTWGLPGVYDSANWSNELFNKARSGINYKNCQNAWEEQREFNNLAISALKDHPLAKEIRQRLQRLHATVPSTAGMIQLNLHDHVMCGNSTIRFDGTKGGIIVFSDGKTNWADAGFPLAQISYRTFNETDFDYMMDYYGGNAGYSKYNSTCAQSGCANPEDSLWYPEMKQLWLNKATCEGVVFLDFLATPHKKYAKNTKGAPEKVYLKFKVVRTPKSQVGIDFDLILWNKTPTRLPEQMMVEFRPKKTNLDWQMDKLGSWVSPKDVNLNGSQYQHAVWSGFKGVESKDSFLQVNTFDAPLVAPITPQRPFVGWSGTPTVMPVPTAPLSEVSGMGVNLFNNVWDTNYILWYPYLVNSDDQNIVFRFSVLGTSRTPTEGLPNVILH